MLSPILLFLPPEGMCRQIMNITRLSIGYQEGLRHLHPAELYLLIEFRELRKLIRLPVAQKPDQKVQPHPIKLL